MRRKTLNWRGGTRSICGLSGLIVTFGGLASVGLAANTHVKVCELRGGQENPPVATPARGCGRFVIDTNANTISYYIAYTALTGTETAAHFHGNAAPGSNAGVKIGLPPGTPKVGVATYAEADEAALLAGEWYVNIHSTFAPGGELRGQIADFVADINGFQENPSVASSGGAWGVFNIDRCSNTLNYYISIDGLDGAETNAHIHGFALHGVNAGVKHPLTLGSPKVGAWVYNEADESAIMSGQTYVNIHSSIAGGGEIRGQIVNIVAPIDGSQENPPTGSTSYGCGMFAIDKGTDNLSYFIAHNGLPTGESAAHIHGYAPSGSNAGVVHPLPAGMNKKGVWNYPAGDEGMILDGLTYINIHSPAHPGGEIRGQILFPNDPCTGDVDCSGETDVVDLLAMLAAWGPCPTPPVPCPTDTNKDGTTDIVDLLALLAQWGKCP